MMFDKPEYHFLPEYVDRAKTLGERWGVIEVPNPQDVKMEDVDEDLMEDLIEEPMEDVLEEPMSVSSDSSTSGGRRRDSATNRRHGSSSDSTSKKRRIVQPPPTHYVWGTDGIMHGVARSIARKPGRTPKFTVVSNRSRLQPRSCKVFGHNGLEVGAWFARRLTALIHGAHGESQGGICGDENGAFSIVVAGEYERLDRDEGEHLYYSGSGSHENDDPNRPPPPTRGTKALHESLRSGKAVRVIRGSTGKKGIAPTCGFRYDGLYRVVTVTHPINDNHGRYEQFGLMRLGDQEPIDKARPARAEVRAFGMIDRGYPGTNT